MLQGGTRVPPFFFLRYYLHVIPRRLVNSFTHAALSPDPDLAVAALMIARVEYPRLDASPYLDRLDALGDEARRRVELASARRADVPPHADPILHARVMALNAYLFGELRFAGNDVHYEDPRNSCLNEVLDRRTGIPITLALIYIEVARRAGLHVEGVNFPGHFLVRCPAPRAVPTARDLIIDAYHGGAILSEEELLRRYARPENPDDVQAPSRLLAKANKPQILSRMLLNLKHVYVNMHSFPQARDITDLLLAVNPSAIDVLKDRGLLAFKLNDFPAALRDLQAYLQLSRRADPESDQREEHEQIWEHIKNLRRRVASLN
jgi:regulator of sirC expression with transglutaminase-like and TPR domain